MSFPLTSAPATFFDLMNDVFYDFLNKVVAVYLDNLVSYSASLEDHLNYLKFVGSKAKGETTICKAGKVLVCWTKVMFLGSWVFKVNVWIDGGRNGASLNGPHPPRSRS